MGENSPVTQPQLRGYKGHLKRVLTLCDKELAKATPSHSALEDIQTDLKGQFGRYGKAFSCYEVEQKWGGAEYEAELESHNNFAVEYREMYSKLCDKLETLSTRASAAATTATSVRPKTVSNILPSMELPSFQGDRRDWPAFWQTFEAIIHQNTELDPVVKFTYLKKSLKGEAARKIRGFSGIRSDYSSAVELLTKYYNDERAIRHDLTVQFMTIRPPKCNVEELSQFYTTYSTLLRQLQAYVPEFDKCEWMVAATLQNKLPEAFLKYLYDRYHENYFDEEQISEGIQDFSKRSHLTQPPEPAGSSAGPSRTHAKSHRPLSTPAVAVQNVAVDKPCLFCSSPHAPRRCSQYPTVSARRARLEEMGMCSRCCTSSHKTADCKTGAFRPCPTCNLTNHHGYLCFRLNPQSSHINATTNTSPSSANSTTNSQGQGSTKNSKSKGNKYPWRDSQKASTHTTFASLRVGNHGEETIPETASSMD